LLFTVTSTAFPEISNYFKLTQPLTVSVKEKGGKPDKKPYPLPYGLRNPCRNLKSKNCQEYGSGPAPSPSLPPPPTLLRHSDEEIFGKGLSSVKIN
jgi:hypothetical protein